MGSCIKVCGNNFNIGTKVVLWDDPLGLNAYATNTNVYYEENRKTGKKKKRIVSGKRYGKRTLFQPNFKELKNIVCQFFLHHDGMYRSRDTFNVLHNERGLSCHFLLDDDGVIYQTLDLVERAFHGGKCNPVSIGIEIANRALSERHPSAYDSKHRYKFNVGLRETSLDKIHGKTIKGYVFNNRQYYSLILLAQKLLKIFPCIQPTFPFKDFNTISKTIISNPEKHKGFICHYNASVLKVDPICFDHNRFLGGIFDTQPIFNFLDTWKSRQEALIALGYNPGFVDGIFGPKTQDAIVQFQKDHKLDIFGFWNVETNKTMLKLVNNRG